MTYLQLKKQASCPTRLISDHIRDVDGRLIAIRWQPKTTLCQSKRIGYRLCCFPAIALVCEVSQAMDRLIGTKNRKQDDSQAINKQMADFTSPLVID